MSGEVPYDQGFYDYMGGGALRAAEVLLPPLAAELRPGSVLDVGCGHGFWLVVWKRLGSEVVGLDGHHVDRSRLAEAAITFIAHDLSKPFRLGRRFDLVQCLEVAEHLPGAASDGLIDSLTAHGDLVLFSAAPPGQSGLDHINERPYEFWRARFAARGFVALDCVRPLHRDNPEVEPWYRYNTLLYAREDRLDRLPPALAATRLGPGRVPDLSPPLYRLRKAILRILPVGLRSLMARLRAAMLVRFKSGRDG